MDAFVKGTARVFHLGGTAGGGKSSKIIYGAFRLRAEAITFRVVVFSVKAKEELQERVSDRRHAGIWLFSGGLSKRDAPQ